MVYVVGSDPVYYILSVTLECRDVPLLAHAGIVGVLVGMCCCFQMYSSFVW